MFAKCSQDEKISVKYYSLLGDITIIILIRKNN